MKNYRSLTGLLAVTVTLALAGCVGPAYDPTQTTRAVALGDKIQITSITAKPEHPVVPQSCQVTILVKNVSDKALTDVEYVFDLGSDNSEYGRGKIASIQPGETIELKSKAAKLPQGIYRFEGKVFLSKSQEESKFEDRMNNVKAVTVSITN